MVHRQETVDCLKKFNARRKLKVSTVINDIHWIIIGSLVPIYSFFTSSPFIYRELFWQQCSYREILIAKIWCQRKAMDLRSKSRPTQVQPWTRTIQKVGHFSSQSILNSSRNYIFNVELLLELLNCNFSNKKKQTTKKEALTAVQQSLPKNQKVILLQFSFAVCCLRTKTDCENDFRLFLLSSSIHQWILVVVHLT